MINPWTPMSYQKFSLQHYVNSIPSRKEYKNISIKGLVDPIPNLQTINMRVFKADSKENFL